MRVLLNEMQLRAGVEKLANEISAYYAKRSLVMIGVNSSSIMLLADIARLLETTAHLRIAHSPMHNGGPMRPERLHVDADWVSDIRGQEVLLVDDVLETGKTMFELACQLDGFRPTSLRFAVLLQKYCLGKAMIEPDHVAFSIPNEVVVGYGLDYHGAIRNLPHIAALDVSAPAA